MNHEPSQILQISLMHMGSDETGLVAIVIKNGDRQLHLKVDGVFDVRIYDALSSSGWAGLDRPSLDYVQELANRFCTT